jgi:hypothetical protein
MYLKTLALCAALFAAGWLLTLPFSYAAGSLPFGLLDIAVHTLAGAAGILSVFALFGGRALGRTSGGKSALKRGAGRDATGTYSSSGGTV